MVHAVVAHASPGEVLVLTSAEPAPVALVGELLATQAQARGVAGILVDGAVRDLDELVEIGLPIWARFVRAQGATKGEVGELDVPVVIGGAEIRPGDLVVHGLRRGDGAPGERVDEVLAARARARGAGARDAAALRGGRALLRPERAPRDRGGLMEVAVLGLGEAGGRIAADLVGGRLHGARLGPCAAAGGNRRMPRAPIDAVRGADVVLSINAAAVALDAAAGVAGALGADALYADLNTASPQLKRELAAALPVQFADVALSASSRARACARRRSRPARAPSASPSSSGRSECPSRSSARTRATLPA